MVYGKRKLTGIDIANIYLLETRGMNSDELLPVRTGKENSNVFIIMLWKNCGQVLK